MPQTVFARFDGNVIVPEEVIAFPLNTRLRITIEFAPETAPDDYIFLRTARAQKVEGPADWSERTGGHLDGGSTD